MKKSIIFCIMICFYTNIYAQFNIENALLSFDKKTLEAANTAKSVSYLVDDEKKLIFYGNLARLNPALFLEKIVIPYTQNDESEYVTSLKDDLKKMLPIHPHIPYKPLAEAAKFHAEDMGKTGEIGHTSTDGTSFGDRLKRYVKMSGMAENCSYGKEKPIDILMQLLIDDGVPNKGHRVSILSPKYFSIGVSIKAHQRYGINAVQDFSTIKPEGTTNTSNIKKLPPKKVNPPKNKKN